MKSLYIESSAILKWLFGETGSGDIVKLINRSELVVSSSLSILETKRAMLRAENQKLISAADAKKLTGLFSSTILDWAFVEITEGIRERASSMFPVEPVRSLDAIHLASMLELLIIYPDMTILSYDQRILDNLEPLGLVQA